MARPLVGPLLALAVAAGAAGSERAATVHFDFAVADEQGRPVTDLGPHEVRIVDGDRLATPSVLRFVAAGGPGRESVSRPDAPGIGTDGPVPRPSVEPERVIGFLLDEYHVQPEATTPVRAAVARFIEERLAPGDYLAVLKPLENASTLPAILNREPALRAVAAFEGRQGDFAPRNAFERDYIAADARRVAIARAQLTLSALESLVFHVGGAGFGRKAIVVVSEGFPQAPRRRERDAAASLEALIRASTRTNVSFHLVHPHAVTGEPSASGGVTRDVGSPDVRATDVPENTLLRLATETGGTVTRRAGDLAAGWSRIVGHLGNYYLATFPGAVDGRFHPLEVRVTRPGTRVTARHGYWAPARESLTALATASAPPPALPGLRSSPLVRPWFGQTRGDGGRTRVTFAWEPTSPVPGARNRALPAVRVGLTAYAADGTQLFRGSVAPTGRPAANEPAAVTFEAPPGRIRVQMAIEDMAARVVDTDVRDVVVSPLAGAVSIGTPSVIRTRTARDRRAAAADEHAAPTVSRDFSRVEHLLIRVPVYAGGVPTVTATLLGRMGRPLRELSVTRRGDTDVYEVEFPLAPFAIGEYAVRLTAASAEGTAREIVPVRVIP